MNRLIIVLAVGLSLTAHSSEFTDRDLHQLLESGRSGILFSWSPHMPLSMKALAILQRLAHPLHLNIIPVLDPDADIKMAQVVSIKHRLGSPSLRKIASSELLELGLGIHFPAVLVFRNGKIRGGVIPGSKEPQIYRKLILREMNSP